MCFLTVSCAACGPVDVGIERAVLRTSSSRSDEVCIVRCPQCSRRVERGVDPAMASVLRAAGIALAVIPPGPSSTLHSRIDDVELSEFRQHLASTDELVRWLTDVERTP